MPRSKEQASTIASALDTLLMFQKRTPEGHILITPRKAKDVLADILYQFYIDRVGQADAKITALSIIGDKRDENELSDLTEEEETIRVVRKNQAEKDFRKSVYGSPISPAEPERPLT